MYNKYMKEKYLKYKAKYLNLKKGGAREADDNIEIKQEDDNVENSVEKSYDSYSSFNNEESKPTGYKAVSTIASEGEIYESEEDIDEKSSSRNHYGLGLLAFVAILVNMGL